MRNVGTGEQLGREVITKDGFKEISDNFESVCMKIVLVTNGSTNQYEV